MQIGFSFVDLALGGAQIFLVQLAQGLAKRGHRISYFLSIPRKDKIHAVPELVSAIDGAASMVNHPNRLLSCQVIQLDGYHSLARKIPYLFSMGRCVETFHSEYSLKRSGPLYAHYKVTNSKMVQKLLKAPSYLIYQGVPLPQEYTSIPTNFDIAILGRIHPVKNHLLFLQICERLFQQRGKLEALIIGGHPTSSAYQRQIDGEINRLRDSGINFHITNDIPPHDVYKWLSQARLLLITSKTEGFGRMAIEAMACKVPVIANPVGGLLEIIEDGKNGYFAQIDEVHSFTELSNSLLDNEKLRDHLGKQGRLLVERCFSIDRMLDSYEALYQEVVKGK